VASALGAHRAVGTRLEVRDGMLTGRLDLSGATGYADSGSDLPLLEQCGTAVAVNPDAELRRWASDHQWPVVRFR
jgi:phosphoserine phosphatase